MPDYTSPTGSHWVDAVHRRLDTGHYGPSQSSVHNSQLFVRVDSRPQAQALATSLAGSGAIGERCEDSDTFRTWFLALVGAPIVITCQVPLPPLMRGGHVAGPHIRTWKPGQTL